MGGMGRMPGWPMGGTGNGAGGGAPITPGPGNAPEVGGKAILFLVLKMTQPNI